MVEGGSIRFRPVCFRPAKEALHLIAAPLLQYRGLVLGLDPLGGDGHAQRLA